MARLPRRPPAQDTVRGGDAPLLEHGPRPHGMNRRDAIVLLGGVLVAPCLHAEKASPAHTFERGLMGTRFAISCHHGNAAEAKAAADAAFDAAEEINRVASDYIADSELLNLSRRPSGEPTTVSPQLFRLLSEA
ncbi:MAG: hypothetical protein EOP85_19725, partial [Verrucomicrobiaceae bacterium]